MTRLAIATGDPAGIGPEVSVRALAALGEGGALGEGVSATLFGDGRDLHARLARAGLGGRVEVHDVGPCDPAIARAHADHAASGRLALAALDAAIDAVLAGRAGAVVTAPVSKGAITLSGTSFVGQTEHLARRVGIADDAVTMMFLGPRLRVALATTHLAVRDVPAEITAPRVRRATLHLAEALARLEVPAGALVSVSGLNPHAGEHGLFGDEEERVIAPALDALRREPPFSSGRLVLEGPRPAEAVFREAQAGRIAGVVAMFHDQATIASKLLDWGHAVNVTWGLPFVRTSVDHGVAYEAARAGTAEADGMIAAVELALRLARVPR